MKYIVCRNNREYVNEDGNFILSLKMLDRVNILVGENNSGKSRFIRYLLVKSSINECYIYLDDEVEVNESNNITTAINNIINKLSFLCKDESTLLKFHYLKNNLSKYNNLFEKCIFLLNYYNLNCL